MEELEAIAAALDSKPGAERYTIYADDYCGCVHVEMRNIDDMGYFSLVGRLYAGSPSWSYYVGHAGNANTDMIKLNVDALSELIAFCEG